MFRILQTLAIIIPLSLFSQDHDLLKILEIGDLELSKKNYFAQSIFGSLFGALNGFVILALIISVIF